MEEFLSWLHEHGAQFPKVQFPSSTPLGRGATALGDIETNEVMITIPSRLMVSEQNALLDPTLGPILLQHDHLKGDILLAFYIMHELVKGNSSFYSPYFNIIPAPSTITHWSIDIIPLFQDSALVTIVKFRLSDLRKMFQTVSVFCEEHIELFPGELYTFELFKYSYGIIQNRAFGRRLPWSALVPLADCLNHANVQTKYDYNVEANDSFRIYPSGSNRYLEGQEVFNSYGRRENANLLLDYGFAILDNEWETISLTVRLHQHEELFLEKAKLLQRLRLNTIIRYSFSRFNLPLDLITFYRIIALSSDELAHANEDITLVRRSIGLDAEIRAMTLLLDSLARLMKLFPTTIDDDEHALQALDDYGELPDSSADLQVDAEQWHSILKFRITQKRIIQKTLIKLKYLRRLLTGFANAVSQNNYAVDFS